MERLATFSIALTLAVFLFGGCGDQDAHRPIRVFAAASLTDVLEALADTFQTMPHGERLSVNVAGSSLLARQIDRGAVADLYVSAHPSWTDYLQERGRIRPAVPLPISNRLVEIHRRGDVGKAPRLAVADPAHVPAGMYARDALTCEGVWEDVESRIVPTMDVRAAVAAVQTGAVASAIVYRSDALFAPELDVRDAVSERCQPSVRYTAAVVLTSTRAREATRFVDLLRNPSMAPLWRRYGFTYHEAQ